jgi:hypothetical protein
LFKYLFSFVCVYFVCALFLFRCYLCHGPLGCWVSKLLIRTELINTPTTATTTTTTTTTTNNNNNNNNNKKKKKNNLLLSSSSSLS